jgi:histone deacetylase complex subunit SAP18
MTMTETKLTGEVSKVDRSIDRLKTCPLLLRVFCNKNRHHLAREYEQGHTPENELQIYTWMDATLGELTQLIKEVNPDARRRGTQFSFSIVSADDSYNRYYLTDIGKTENGHRRSDDQIQLANKRFRVGDYLDVAIIQKRPEQTTSNPRRDRPPQPTPDDNTKRRNGPSNERNGGSGGPVRSAPRNDHRDRPY